MQVMPIWTVERYAVGSSLRGGGRARVGGLRLQQRAARGDQGNLRQGENPVQHDKCGENRGVHTENLRLQLYRQNSAIRPLTRSGASSCGKWPSPGSTSTRQFASLLQRST